MDGATIKPNFEVGAGASRIGIPDSVFTEKVGVSTKRFIRWRPSEISSNLEDQR